MKLDDLTRYDKEMAKTKAIYGIITLIAVCSLPVMYYLNLQKIAEISKTGFVTDPTYRSYFAVRRELTTTERKYQLESHARETWEKMWTVDKQTIKVNIDLALEGSDQSAELIYEEYFVEKGLETKIMESNWESELTVLTCIVDMNTVPVTGKITSRWTIVRPGGSDDRHLDVDFVIEDSGISPKNPYGASMKKLDIIDNTKF